MQINYKRPSELGAGFDKFARDELLQLLRRQKNQDFREVLPFERIQENEPADGLIPATITAPEIAEITRRRATSMAVLLDPCGARELCDESAVLSVSKYARKLLDRRDPETLVVHDKIGRTMHFRIM